MKSDRAYGGREGDRATVKRIVNTPPSELMRQYYDQYYSYLGVSVLNYADPDPRLMVCQVTSQD